MTNLEKYNQAFIEALDVDESELSNLTYKSITTWNSVGHMSLIAAIEDTFDIELTTDDIFDLSSYEKGKDILKKYSVEF